MRKERLCSPGWRSEREPERCCGDRGQAVSASLRKFRPGRSVHVGRLTSLPSNRLTATRRGARVVRRTRAPLRTFLPKSASADFQECPDSCSVCRIRAGKRCVSASGFQCSRHALNNRVASRPAQTHRGPRWLDTPCSHYFNYPAPVQFCHELRFYFSAISQIEELHPGFLFFCKLILQPGATATRIESRPLNLRKFRERFFRESGRPRTCSRTRSGDNQPA